jgi:histidinol-phosphatase
VVEKAEQDDIFLETALMAAHEAGQFVADRFTQTNRFGLKEDGSAITDVDVGAEQLIMRIIKERHPSHGFICEESGQSGISKEFNWVIDPIDGTKNFLRRVPLFSVEIALLREGIPHIGVSSLPIMGDTLWAIQGRGTHSSSGTASVSKVQCLEDAYLSFGNIKHFARKGLLSHLSNLASAVSQCRGFGDSWSFHLLSRGNIDVFVDAHTALWDVAAVTVIVQEAGGIVTDLNGAPIREHSTSIIATNAHLHSLVLGSFRDRHTTTDRPSG